MLGPVLTPLYGNRAQITPSGGVVLEFGFVFSRSEVPFWPSSVSHGQPLHFPAPPLQETSFRSRIGQSWRDHRNPEAGLVATASTTGATGGCETTGSTGPAWRCRLYDLGSGRLRIPNRRDLHPLPGQPAQIPPPPRPAARRLLSTLFLLLLDPNTLLSGFGGSSWTNACVAHALWHARLLSLMTSRSLTGTRF